MLRRPIPNKEFFELRTSHRPVHQKFHQGTTAILASKMGLQAWEVVVVQTSEKQSLCIARLRGVCLSLSLSIYYTQIGHFSKWRDKDQAIL